MNRSGAKVVVISKSNDKRQVTAVLANHWSNEETMKRYLFKVVVPFLDAKRKS